MNFEGLWAIYYGDVVSDNPAANGGMVVLETARVLGGDSVTAYLGHYEIYGRRLIADARVWTHNPTIVEATSAFGAVGPKIDIQVRLEGEAHPDSVTGRDAIIGQFWNKAEPGNRLPFMLRWIADLP